MLLLLSTPRVRVVTVVVVAFFPFSFVFRRSFSSFFFLLLRRAQTQRAGPAGRFGALLVCMFVRSLSLLFFALLLAERAQDLFFSFCCCCCSFARAARDDLSLFCCWSAGSLQLTCKQSLIYFVCSLSFSVPVKSPSLVSPPAPPALWPRACEYCVP